MSEHASPRKVVQSPLTSSPPVLQSSEALPSCERDGTTSPALSGFLNTVEKRI